MDFVELASNGCVNPCLSFHLVVCGSLFVEQVNETVQTNRKYQLEAAIVRVMKSNKRMSHAELVAEVCGFTVCCYEFLRLVLWSCLFILVWSCFYLTYDALCLFASLFKVTQQLLRLYTPQPRDIKRAIDSLIEREYLERDKEDSSVYVYSA